jgi:photosystem II stability/assembly factor-like uncharacterized protein
MSKARCSPASTAVLLAVAASFPLFAQPRPTIPVAEEFERLHFRSIGPAVNSGRIADIAAYEANPSIYYVGSAHGGVWKTTSNGLLFTPLMQQQGLMSIGAVAVSQSNPDLVWVGTGEANNRQSTSWGDGIYKSTDGGATFQHMGLARSQHINRIVIDPANNDVVLVAAPGPLFGPGGDRGVFKSTDGGKTWKQVLKGDEDTGANELVMSHANPKILFASTYQRRRTACCMNGGGPGSAVWKSTDGGDTWTKVGGGLPSGSLGRIALDVYRDNPNIVYALIEGPGGGGRGGRGNAAEATSTGVYRSDDGGTSWRKMSSVNPRPMYFSQLRIDPKNSARLLVGGVGLHMSIDSGKTFETNADQVIHSDHHAIWIDPNTAGHIIVGNDGGLAVSHDWSKTWAFVPNLPVGLFYHVAYDMETPFNVCGGMQDNYNWCGPSVSRHTHGIMSYDWIEIEGGDGFVVIPDLRDSRYIYSEAQDGNMIRRNKITGEGKQIRPSAQNVTPAPAKGEAYRFNWDTPLMFSPHDPGVLLTAANKVFKSSDRGDSWTVISPDLTTNANRDTVVTMGLKNSETTISRNDGVSAWPTITTLAESPKQPGVYYTGTDDGTVSMSRDGGKTWQNITKNIPGFPPGHAYVSKVTPSRFDAATVYVMVDNHRLNDFEPYIWVSNDFGKTFRSIKANLAGENVRTLTEDLKNPDVLYMGTESGLFLSLDRGKSWRRLRANFPNVRVDEITLHPRDNAMLIATHGRALWILDHLEPIQEFAASEAAAGDAKLFTIPTALEWKTMDNRNDEFWGHQYFVGENPPIEGVIQFRLKRPVDDLKLRISDPTGKRIRDLAIPAKSNVAGIQSACWDLRVEPNPADSAAAGGRGGGEGQGRGSAPAVPGIPTPEPEVGYKPASPCGEIAGVGTAGFGVGGPAHFGPYVLPATYTVALMSGNRTLDTKRMKIIMDPAVKLADADRRRYDALVMELHDAQRIGMQTAAKLNALYPQMTAAATKLKSATNAPSSLTSQFDALSKQFDAVRVKFGVPAAAAGGRGGGGGRGGANPDDVLAQLSALKVGVGAMWESPTPAIVRQSTAARSALQQAVTEANAFFSRAAALSAALKAQDVSLSVPPAK